MQVDYNSLLQNASLQNAAAQNGVSALTYGILPESYTTNMQNTIQSGVENSLGTALTNLSNRGVLSSSVANNALQNISANAASTMADNYLNNISTLNGLYGQQASLANSNITSAAAAQEAAQQPALNLWNASTGLNQSTLGALAGVAGQGTTTTTQSTSGSSSVIGSLLGGALTSAIGGYTSGLACFTDDTEITMADGSIKLIRRIEVGDEVKCPNEDGTTSTETVIALQPTKYSDTYAVICKDKLKTNVVYTTLTQPLLTTDGEFVEVSVMKIGTNLKGAGKVTGIVESGERRIYDFKTTGANRYYANGFVAHGAYDEQVSEGVA